MEDDGKSLRDLFIMEGRECIDSINQYLRKMPDGLSEQDIDEFFRQVHTLKGLAGTMGFKTMVLLAHRVEGLLDMLRKQKVKITDEFEELVTEGCDILEAMLEEVVESGNVTVEDQEYVEKVKRFVSGVEGSNEMGRGEERVMGAGEREGVMRDSRYKITIILEEDTSMPSVRLLQIATLLEKASLKPIASIPSWDDLLKGTDALTIELYYSSDADVDKVIKTVKRVGDVRKVEMEVLEKTQSSKEIAGESAEGGHERGAPTYHRGGVGVRTKMEEPILKVRYSTLEGIMSCVEELVIIKNHIAGLTALEGDRKLKEAVWTLSKTIEDLHWRMIDLGMVPLENIFNMFPRLARNIARKLNKKVVLIVEGGEIKLDRAIVDQLYEVILHLIRNAIDHGIEPPEERKRIGKPEKGKIILKALRERTHVIIEIKDDGRGIDKELVLRRAVEKGIISPEAAKNATDKEAFELLFLPGFTTAESVSEISGRGVGLDVVRTHISNLGGLLEISSKKNVYTSIRLTLPITRSLVRSLIIEHCGVRYALPIYHVKEIVSPTNYTEVVLDGKKRASVRGTLYPVYDFVGEHLTLKMERERKVLIILERGQEEFGILVDRVLYPREVVIRPLKGSLKNVRGYSGYTIMGDGSVVPILDVNAIGTV
ncbi:MAG: chemotaxis protein CheA [Thermoplasmata archaeon]|nr:chemotaxis protein CheA [Thermoplasmata archaeon]